MAQLFYLPFLPVPTQRGLPAGAAKAYFYESGTTTLKTIYADAALTTPLANPVVADAMGRLPNIYMPDNAVYRVRIVDHAGASLGADADPYVAGAAITIVPDLPDLAAPSGATKVGFQQTGTGSVPHTVAASLKQIGIVPADFSIVGDQSDETAKLQAAIDAAATNKVPLFLHGAPIIGISAPLNLKGRYVDIRGNGIKNTIIVAKNAMTTMIDAEETTDMIISPFTIRGLRLAGGALAQYGIRTRYRHYGLLEDIYIDATTTTGLWEKDAWNNRRIGVTIQACPIGFHLVGSNHRTAWISCAVAGASGSHWIVGSQGTAADGNYAVLLKNCDIEFGTGKGLVVESAVTLALEDCYVGEGIGGVVIETRGFVSARGGALFIGSTASSTVRPLGGLLTIEGAAVNGQGNETLASLGKLLPTEIVTSGVGAVAYRNCLGNINATPTGVDGEPFGAVPGRAYANRSGRTYTKTTFGGADATLTYDGDTIIVTVTNAGTNGKISISTPLNDDWSRNGPVFFMPSYQSTMAVTAKLSNGPLGAGYTLVALGANTNIQQVPILNSVPSALPYTVLEFVIETPVANGVFRLTRTTFSDAMFQNKRGGAFGTIGMIA